MSRVARKPISERFPLPLGARDRLCYFIVAPDCGSPCALHVIILEYPQMVRGLNFFPKPKSQRNCGLFCVLCKPHSCIHQNVFKNIMSSHLSIAWNIGSNRQSLKLEETANFIEVG